MNAIKEGYFEHEKWRCPNCRTTWDSQINAEFCCSGKKYHNHTIAKINAYISLKTQFDHYYKQFDADMRLISFTDGVFIHLTPNGRQLMVDIFGEPKRSEPDSHGNVYESWMFRDIKVFAHVDGTQING